MSVFVILVMRKQDLIVLILTSVLSLPVIPVTHVRTLTVRIFVYVVKATISIWIIGNVLIWMSARRELIVVKRRSSVLIHLVVITVVVLLVILTMV